MTRHVPSPVRVVREVVRLVWFWLVDRLTSSSQGDILVVLRDSSMDSDSAEILEEFHQRWPQRRAYAVVHSRTRFESVSTDRVRGKLHVVETQSQELPRALLRCKLVFLSSENDIWPWRLLSKRGKRLYVRIFHGIVT